MFNSKNFRRIKYFFVGYLYSMNKDTLNAKNIAIFLIIVLGIVLIIWLVLPKYSTIIVPANIEQPRIIMPPPTIPMEQYEYYNNIPQPQNEEENKTKYAIPNVKPVMGEEIRRMPIMPDRTLPFVDPKTGVIMDGPGFEPSPMTGISGDIVSKIPSNYYFLDDGASGAMSLQHNLCSKSCCDEQWPLPFKMKYDPFVCQNKNDFVPSNLMCKTSYQDAGCMCLTKEQAKFLATRGSNGSEWF